MSFPQLRSKIVNQLTSGTAAVAYTLAAAAGSYNVTGTSATLVNNHVISAASGAVTVTGTDATLNKGFTLTAVNGTYSVTGTAAGFGISIPADSGAYTLTGTSLVLSYNSLSADLSVSPKWQRNIPRAFQPALFGKRRFNSTNTYAVVANSGTYTFVGTDASLSPTQIGNVNQRDKLRRAWPRAFAPGPWGHLTLSRSVNRISYTTASYSVIAGNGTYTLTGSSVNLLEQHVIPVQSGNIGWNVFSATLNRGRTLASDVGIFNITSPEALFAIGMPATAGNWIWTGASSNDVAARILTADGGQAGYWRLADASGTTATDSVGTHNGVISGGVTLNQPAAFTGGDAAMAFDGVTGKITVPSSVLNCGSATQSFSLELWINGAYLEANGGLLFKGAGPNNVGGIGWELRHEGTTFWEFARTANGPATRLQWIVNVPQPSAWTHLAITYDAVAHVSKSYVNGVNAATQALSGNDIAAYNDTYPLLIGKGNDGFTAATFDDVAIYPVALTASQVRSRYANSTAIWTGSPAALISSKAAVGGSYIWSGNVVSLRWSGESVSGKGGMLLLGAG
jgi:hypothetical protein